MRDVESEADVMCDVVGEHERFRKSCTHQRCGQRIQDIQFNENETKHQQRIVPWANEL